MIKSFISFRLLSCKSENIPYILVNKLFCLSETFEGARLDRLILKAFPLDGSTISVLVVNSVPFELSKRGNFSSAQNREIFFREIKICGCFKSIMFYCNICFYRDFI